MSVVGLAAVALVLDGFGDWDLVLDGAEVGVGVAVAVRVAQAHERAEAVGVADFLDDAVLGGDDA